MIEIQPGLLYLTRADWGVRADIPRLGHPVNRLDRTEAIIHHTVIVDSDATPNRWETMAEVKAKMVQLQTIRPDLGLDVPYNFVAFHMADGSLVMCEGRGLDRTGAHTHAHNTRGIATAGEGNFQIGLTVVPYIDHWSRLWGWLKYDMGMENLGISRPTVGPNVGAIAFGHRDLSSTSCPGDNLYAIIPQLTFKEDGMDEVAVRALFQELMAAHAEPARHHDLNEIADLLPHLNVSLLDTVRIIAGQEDNALKDRLDALEQGTGGGGLQRGDTVRLE